VPATRKSWSETADRALRDAGHRTGGARGSVVELLAQQSCCLSAQEIAERLEARGNAVGLASVYRALELLGGLGLVQRVEFGEGTARYEPMEPDGAHHHHAVCDRCGRVTAFEDDRLEAAIEQLGERLRHTVSGHDVVIHGACPRCARPGAVR